MVSSQVTNTFATVFLVFAALEVRTRLDRVFSRPARKSGQRIEAVCIGSWVGIRNNLSAKFSVLCRIGDLAIR